MLKSLLFLSGAEMFIIVLAILLLFGAKKIPELAKGLGKGMKEFKKATETIKKELDETQVKEITKDVKDIKDKLK